MAMMTDVSMASQFFHAFLMLTYSQVMTTIEGMWVLEEECGVLEQKFQGFVGCSWDELDLDNVDVDFIEVSFFYTLSLSTSLRCLFSTLCHYRLHQGPDAPRQAHERQSFRREGPADEEVGRGGSFLFA